MPTRSLTPRRLAKELAQQMQDLGGGPDAALTVFERMLAPDGAPPFDLERLWAEIRCTAQPVLPEGYLFELLLGELDRDQRRRRGVYYTPLPLVQFIVEAVFRSAAVHFPNRPLHLIDPACGYGAFLLHSRDQWSRRLRHENAPPQIAAIQFTGIELCPVTSSIARLLLSRNSNAQTPVPRVLNANPLTAGESLRELILDLPERSMLPVIVGNPPWSNFGRQNRSPWLSGLMADYRTGLSERKANLSDDAIKFIRWGQYWIDQAGAGILAFVTPNTWLAGITHRRMRESLLATFDVVRIVDLHGESGSPAGDENVFGVRSGVAIVVMVKAGKARLLPSRDPTQSDVRRVDVVGSRRAKFAALVESENGIPVRIHPTLPEFSLALACKRASRTGDYAAFWPLDRIFRHYISGVQTKNDAVFVAFTRLELEAQVRNWLAAQPGPVEFDPRHIQPYLVAPFDRRWIYYDPRLIGRARLSTMRHMLRPNLGLVFMRQSTCPGEYDHFLAVDCLVSDRVFYSRHGAPFLAPLWVGNRGLGVVDWESANFDQRFLDALQAAVGSAAEPLALFHYLYAVAYSPAYRTSFAEELRRGFPRFPLPADAEQFFRLAGPGGRLVDLHLGQPAGRTPETDLPPAGEEGESFRLGGYDVLRRWQSPRRRRDEDEMELPRLAAIGRETRRLMGEIDEASRRDAYPTDTGSSA